MRTNVIIVLYLAALAGLWSVSWMRGSWAGLVVLMIVSAPAVLLLAYGVMRLRHPGLRELSDACRELEELLPGDGIETREKIESALDRIHQRADARPRDAWFRALQFRAMQSAHSWADARADHELAVTLYRKMIDVIDERGVPTRAVPRALLLLEDFALGFDDDPLTAQTAYDRLERLARAAPRKPAAGRLGPSEFATAQRARLLKLSETIRELSARDADAADSIRDAYRKLSGCRVPDGAARENDCFLTVLEDVVRWALRVGDRDLLASVCRDFESLQSSQPAYLRGTAQPPLQRAIRAIAEIALRGDPDVSEQAIGLLGRLASNDPSAEGFYNWVRQELRR